MPESGHVRVSAAAPATTLRVSLEYAWAVNIYNVLAGDGYVEANPEFSAAIEPSAAGSDAAAMVDATPGYLEAMAAELQSLLNEVALNDVCTFIEAMNEAGTPEQIGEAAWTLIMDVYDNVAPGAQPAEDRFSCIEVCVELPGQECPP